MLVKITTKHAINSPVMLVTHKPFFFSAVMLSKLRERKVDKQTLCDRRDNKFV